MSAQVPRIGRILDAVGGAVFLVGAVSYGWAWWQLHRLQDVQPEGVGFPALARAEELTTLSRAGIALMAAGAVVAVVAAVVARRRSGDG